MFNQTKRKGATMKVKHFIPMVGIFLAEDEDFKSVGVGLLFGIYQTFCWIIGMVGGLFLFIEIIW
jgi:hypothetical protein